MIFRFQLKLQIAGPLMFKSSVQSDPGIDTSPAVSVDGNFLLLPGTHLQGKIREAAAELAELKVDSPKPIDELLGPALKTMESTPDESNRQNHWKPMRGSLAIQDLSCPIGQMGRTRRHRISIDSELGGARKNFLQVLELPQQAGGQLEFAGEVLIAAPDSDSAKKIADWIRACLVWSGQLGSNRTIGYGRVLNVELMEREVDRVPSKMEVEKIISLDHFGLEIIPNSPLCFAERRSIRNLFKSLDYIPGGAIKGSIATKLEKQGTSPDDPLLKNLDKIRILHAFPSGATPRARVAPLSLVYGSDCDSPVDVALCDGPILLDGVSPRFNVDWKNESVSDRFGWIIPNRELRVRTAIDSEYRRARKDHLFAYEMIVPSENYCWKSAVDLTEINDPKIRSEVRKRLIEELADGIDYLGKTSASARVKAVVLDSDEFLFSSSAEPLNESTPTWVVTLQSAALLLNPAEMRSGSFHSGRPDELTELYRREFLSLSANNLSLIRHFSQQELAGNYLVKRFRGGQPYDPYLLTMPGSVFVFVLAPKADVKAAIAGVQSWLDHGLKLPSWFSSDGESSWEKCPFLRQNGYGEVSVNLSCHTLLRPVPGKFEEVEVKYD